MFVASMIGRGWYADKLVAVNSPAIDYATQNGVALAQPTTKAELYHTDNVHYLQVAYNAMGADIVENLLDYLRGTDETVTFRLMRTNGNEEIPDSVTLTDGQELMVIPLVEPITTDDLTFELSGTGALTIKRGGY